MIMTKYDRLMLKKLSKTWEVGKTSLFDDRFDDFNLSCIQTGEVELQLRFGLEWFHWNRFNWMVPMDIREFIWLGDGCWKEALTIRTTSTMSDLTRPSSSGSSYERYNFTFSICTLLSE